MTAPLQIIHSRPLSQPKPINQHDRESIADRCLVHGASRFTVARQYGVHTSTINDICDDAMFRRGYRAGRNAAKFQPPMGRAA